jgi:hypothetical protein
MDKGTIISPDFFLQDIPAEISTATIASNRAK